MARRWLTDSSIEELRTEIEIAARVVTGADDPREPAMELWRIGFAHEGSNSLAAGLWPIWGGITDSWTHPEGDDATGAAEARESAAELLDALGDDQREAAYCDRWYSRITGNEAPS